MERAMVDHDGAKVGEGQPVVGSGCQRQSLPLLRPPAPPLLRPRAPRSLRPLWFRSRKAW